MTYKTPIFIILAILFISGCKENTDNRNNHLAMKDTILLNNHPGKKLMETYCYACHNPTTSHDNRLAPPMIAVKKHYINSNTTKEEFVNSILKWIKNPNEEDAKMFGAVRRFGVMVKQPFPEKDIKLIAEYLFENDIEQPKWFKEHEKEMKKRKN